MSSAEEPLISTPQAALDRLLAGNRRFMETRALHPNATLQRVQDLALAQEPFAVLLTCADSRVAPEILFDQGLGDLFVTRIAGNYVDEGILGSMEYAVTRLGVMLILVLGHERCGAIQAAVQAVAGKVTYTGRVASLIEALRPAVEQARDLAGDPVENAMRANVLATVDLIQTCEPLLAQYVAQGKLMIRGGRYDLDTGEVTLY